MGTGGLFFRKLRARVSQRPTGFVWVESRRLAGSGFPASRGQLDWLRGQGIKTILTLTEEALPTQWLEGLGLEVRHIPMRDHRRPDGTALEEAANFIMESLGRDRTTLVHCMAGEGRTGCVLAAYLIKDRGVSAQEAIAMLRRIKPLFIEREQERAVLEFGSVAKT